MQRTVSAQEARQRLGELLEGVYYRDDEVIIERAGKPMGVVIPMDRYRSIEATRERLWQMFQELWEQNKDVDPAEVERVVGDAVSAVRAERRERRRRDADAGTS
jgi:prevent-host-death family protein